jgi:hypothetical protein
MPGQADVSGFVAAFSGSHRYVLDYLADDLQGYVRVFADEGSPMAALLAQLVAAQKSGQTEARSFPLGYLAQVLRAFGSDDIAPDGRRPVVAAVPGLAEQLMRSTSATSWPSSAPVTAPRPSRALANSA